MVLYEMWESKNMTREKHRDLSSIQQWYKHFNSLSQMYPTIDLDLIVRKRIIKGHRIKDAYIRAYLHHRQDYIEVGKLNDYCTDHGLSLKVMHLEMNENFLEIR